MAIRYRFNFIVNDDDRIIIVRPIGDIPGAMLVDLLLNAYSNVTAPWTYNRVNDFRRYEGYLEDVHLAELARRWSEWTAGISYHSHVAILPRHAFEKLRLPEISPQFPNETICFFGDYHEAVGWVLSADRGNFLAGLGKLGPPRADEGAISVI